MRGREGKSSLLGALGCFFYFRGMDTNEIRKTVLNFLLENNNGKFISLDDLNVKFDEKDVPKELRIPTLVDLSKDGYLDLFPSYSVVFNTTPKEAKITLKGIDWLDNSKVLIAAEKEILGLKISNLKRIILFAIIGYVSGIISPVFTDLARKYLGLDKQENKLPIQIKIQSSLIYKDTVFLYLKDTSLVRLIK